MKGTRRQRLPLRPLLSAYLSAGLPSEEELLRWPILGRRLQAIRTARAEFLNEAFLDHASERDVQQKLDRFYLACVHPALNRVGTAQFSGLLRHALHHLLRGSGLLDQRLRNCLSLAGPYQVPGLGIAFWSALAQALEPESRPAGLPWVEQGLERLGFFCLDPSRDAWLRYEHLCKAYARARQSLPGLGPLHLDHFLLQVGTMRGRDLASAMAETHYDVAQRLTCWREQSSPGRCPPNERRRRLQAARREIVRGLKNSDADRLILALEQLDTRRGCLQMPPRRGSAADTLLLWAARLWNSDEPIATLEAYWRTDPLPEHGMWLPSAILHIRDPKRFPLLTPAARRGLAAIDDGAGTTNSPWQQYELEIEAVAGLCQQYSLHPLEVSDFLEEFDAASPPSVAEDSAFVGFPKDAFAFLGELSEHNCRQWMEAQRERYHFAVRQPLVELCRELARTWVQPVLSERHGWHLETAARVGRALTSIAKNDYARTVPYHDSLWIVFSRRTGIASLPEAALPLIQRHEDVQLFVRLAHNGVSYGVRLGRSAGTARQVFRQNLERHGEQVWSALASQGLDSLAFMNADDFSVGPRPEGADSLRAWAANPAWVVGKVVPADQALLHRDELLGDILLTFARVLPLFACATEADVGPWLQREYPDLRTSGKFGAAEFCSATYLNASSLERLCELVALKRQLILQGVPGTGKTHVARCLARLLTGGRDDQVRLVQFHPAYCYEEFVEGIKVRPVEVDGRQDVSYPVEDGVLCAFAATAAAQPDATFVLIVDEINRANLPKVFGELLYLLEYRGQSLTLPYSKRAFQLPPNLYILGTMNGADRSVTLVDQALRRRFAFLELHPDPAVLEAWLRDHSPAAGDAMAARVVTLFDRLNAQLTADLGPQYRVGHSYFMVPNLDDARLGSVWDHQIRPLLEEYFAGNPARISAYEPERLLGSEHRTRRSRKRAMAAP